MLSSPRIIFFEKQRYDLRWLWLIYLFLGIPLLFVVLYSSWAALEERALSGSWQVSGKVLLLLNGFSLLILLVVPLVISFMVLKVWVFPDHIKIRYGPWYGQRIDLNQVREMKVASFDPMEVFGTHDGYRNSRAIKKLGVFSVRGSKAVQLTLQNEMEVLIGSQKPEVLLKALEKQRQEKE